MVQYLLLPLGAVQSLLTDSIFYVETSLKSRLTCCQSGTLLSSIVLQNFNNLLPSSQDKKAEKRISLYFMYKWSVKFVLFFCFLNFFYYFAKFQHGRIYWNDFNNTVCTCNMMSGNKDCILLFFLVFNVRHSPTSFGHVANPKFSP